MSKIEAHISKLFRDIPDSRQKMDMMQEISQNLFEKVEDLMSQGRTEDEAVQMAIEDFGDDIGDIQRELVGSEKLLKTRNLGLSFAFSVWGGIIFTALFAFINLFTTNYLTSWENPWFIYPSFAVIWWSLSVFLLKPNTVKIYSALSALIILGFFAVDNLINSPDCPWMLFTIYPLLLWPVCVFLGRRALALPTVIGLTVTGIVYYAMLNVFVFTGFPWIIFPIYALLWWPLSAAFAKRGHAMLFSVCGTLLSAALFIILNAAASPQILWAVYPIFLFVWWPLATYYFCYKRRGTPELLK